MTKLGFEIIDEQHIHGANGIMRTITVKYNGDVIYNHSFRGGKEPIISINLLRNIFLKLHRKVLGLKD